MSATTTPRQAQILSFQDEAYITLKQQNKVKSLAQKFNIPLEVAEDCLSEAYIYSKKVSQKSLNEAIGVIWRKANFNAINHIKNGKKNVGKIVEDTKITYIGTNQNIDELGEFDPHNLTPFQKGIASTILVELYQKEGNEQQKALILGRALGYEYEELSGMLGIPLGTVKSSLYNARK